MTDWLVPAFFAIVFVLIGVVLVVRRRKSSSASLPIVLQTNLASSYGKVVRDVSFVDALNSARAGELVAEGFKREINFQLSQSTADGLVVGLEVVRSSQARELILAKFPAETARMLKDETAVQVTTKAGEKLLVAVDKNGRQFISQAKQVDPSVVSKLSQAATLIVGAAHIIAGYDNARKLNAVDIKADRLLSKDSNTLIARLASIYESLREVLVAEISQDTKLHLLSLKKDLKELRSRWLLDAEDDLKRIANPSDRFFLARWFSRKKSVAQGLELELSKLREPLQLVRFALQMEQVIAELINGRVSFEEVTIPEVQQRISALKVLVREREEWIKAHSDTSADNKVIYLCDQFEKSLK